MVSINQNKIIFKNILPNKNTNIHQHVRVFTLNELRALSSILDSMGHWSAWWGENWSGDFVSTMGGNLMESDRIASALEGILAEISGTTLGSGGGFSDITDGEKTLAERATLALEDLATDSIGEMFMDDTTAWREGVSDALTEFIGQMIGGSLSSVGPLVSGALESGTEGIQVLIGMGLMGSINNAGAMVASAILHCCESQDDEGTRIPVEEGIDIDTGLESGRPYVVDNGRISAGSKAGQYKVPLWEDVDGLSPRSVAEASIDLREVSPSEPITIDVKVWDTEYTDQATVDRSTYYMEVSIDAGHPFDTTIGIPASNVETLLGGDNGSGEVNPNGRFRMVFDKAVAALTLGLSESTALYSLNVRVYGVAAYQAGTNPVIPHRRAVTFDAYVKSENSMIEKIGRYKSSSSFDSTRYSGGSGTIH